MQLICILTPQINIFIPLRNREECRVLVLEVTPSVETDQSAEEHLITTTIIIIVIVKNITSTLHFCNINTWK